MKCSSRAPPARRGADSASVQQLRSSDWSCSAASGRLGSSGRRCGSSRPVSRRHSSASAEASREAVLYFSWAAPVFWAAMPLLPTANTCPAGTGSMGRKYRAIGVLANVLRLGREDRSVILAAAEGAYSAIALQGAEALAVLDRAKITGQIGLCCRCCASTRRGRPNGWSRPEPRNTLGRVAQAEALQAGRLGQVARQRMSAPQPRRKVARMRRATVIG